MKYYKIKKSNLVGGEVKISGAKNAILPLICMSILSNQRIDYKNVPNVADVNTLRQLLSNLGASSSSVEGGNLSIDTTGLTNTRAVYDVVRKMRASVLVMGPLLARFGHCEVSLPGGCAIGTRPIDLHLKAMECLGASVEIKNGYVEVSAPNGLQGGTIVFDKVTVTGSENAIMAAALAKGESHLVNVAKEPEVVQLCEVLNESGVKISGIGTEDLRIQGTGGKLLEISNVEVIPDRIEAGTFLCLGAISNKPVTVCNVNPAHLEAVIDKLKEMGCCITIKDSSITIEPCDSLKAIDIVTTEYPGFPTDMQAQFMALTTQAKGVSTIKETLFENRFMHVAELNRMGANIKFTGNTAMVNGGTVLNGADVMATDLRASATLIIAALISGEDTNIHRIYHLERGYDDIVKKLFAIGVDVEVYEE
ncbi:TPA: UDP-N-acetylglucosamine 1-carboxyvinyltransferase [Vibrio parahaemolyticus]|uniref:UDP-N-acetylglucosamine 1-carboxyvinyltransferase n=2 Tax=Vibrio parahaemolyticus TaxID=670 RepID=A0A5P4S626_VIBPH|nr:UDP-N-acetylglucosamine 1-carboxyvinyltransferase [Vibrio parahaemolyticus]EJA7340515.1 UDP-N-acetylglucosamine 1-carboxyvinyltransferase [Vibrio parahaemolyticus]EJG0935419.1 UDP-N-acetylglucosamine 1-carboxyvinyltransferase [Vibrio parahaemolyticus]EJG1994886.1 UDP-N-acetylglucosamine 1-carboxyvinyltransferase [Vibrio parahaemolyticus]MDF4680469.1 UDP-N-acetylglucosamine 1-carboxyvinyltransferase [Vibrio parahaemolyticus]MDF4925332.1 UDP-N-acetylglucosamine 1-carboxyvinyltransferase [Vibr